MIKAVFKYMMVGGILITLSMYESTAQELLPSKELNGATDDLGNLSDRFQELFFEALKQKAITNYDKAIENLDALVEMDPTQTILYVERGKNHYALKQYSKAEENFDKVLEARPEDSHILELQYETYLKLEKYTDAVTVLEKLIKKKSIFKEQLVNLYFLENRYDDALNLLDDVVEEQGSDAYRRSLRQKIMLKLKNPNYQISKIEDEIESGKDSEQDYLNLIYLHSQSGDQKKAYEVAQSMLKKYPKSELVHLSLYKFYLEDNKVEEAIASMKKVIKGKSTDEEAKYKVISDFLVFVNENPRYELELEDLMKQINKTPISKGKIFTELGNFYFKKGQKELALNYYEKGIQSNANDFNLMKRILLLQLDLDRYEKAKLGSELALELYPSNPIFYLINGVALINLNESEEAIDTLSAGMDYIIDDAKMESDFYLQLSLAYGLAGKTEMENKYKAKAEQLQKKS